MLLLRCRIIPNPPHFGGVRDLLFQLRSGDLQMGAGEPKATYLAFHVSLTFLTTTAR